MQIVKSKLHSCSTSDLASLMLLTLTVAAYDEAVRSQVRDGDENINHSNTAGYVVAQMTPHTVVKIGDLSGELVKHLAIDTDLEDASLSVVYGACKERTHQIRANEDIDAWANGILVKRAELEPAGRSSLLQKQIGLGNLPPGVAPREALSQFVNLCQLVSDSPHAKIEKLNKRALYGSFGAETVNLIAGIPDSLKESIVHAFPVDIAIVNITLLWFRNLAANPPTREVKPAPIPKTELGESNTCVTIDGVPYRIVARMKSLIVSYQNYKARLPVGVTPTLTDILGALKPIDMIPFLDGDPHIAAEAINYQPAVNQIDGWFVNTAVMLLGAHVKNQAQLKLQSSAAVIVRTNEVAISTLVQGIHKAQDDDSINAVLSRCDIPRP